MSEELTTVGALDEAKRWVHALRAAEKLESVIAVVLRAETLVADSERALREFDTKIGAKKAEVNVELAKLADVRQRIVAENAKLAALAADATRLADTARAAQAAAEKEATAQREQVARDLAEAAEFASRRKRDLATETATLVEQRDAIKDEIAALQRKVAGVA